MGHLPVIDDVFRVTTEWTVNGSTLMVNVLHFLDSVHDESQVSGVLQSHLTPDMYDAVSSGAHLTGISVLKLDGSSSSFHQSLDGTFDGQGSSDTIYQVAAIVSFGTGLRGPRHRGRIYLPATAENRQDGGVIAPTSVGLMQAAWDTWVDDMRADVCVPVVASYRHADATEITTVDVKSRSGTQRRRNH